MTRYRLQAHGGNKPSHAAFKSVLYGQSARFLLGKKMIDYDEERCSDEEAAEAFKQFQWERDFIQNNERIRSGWEELVAMCDDKRKERKEAR